MNTKVCGEVGQGDDTGISLVINNSKLQQVEVYKYLGVFIDLN